MEKLIFKISSGLKDIIGKELITSDFIAIFELVKNSYDARAKKVSIVFLNVKEHDHHNIPQVLIIDDGDGMSYEDLENKFLFVGYSEKKDFEKKLEKSSDFRDKIQGRRIFAGAKGVGRFSCDRLGQNLRLYSKKENEDFFHVLEINWTNFEEDQEKEFQNIPVNYSTTKELKIKGYPFKQFKKGTILEIYPLSASWDRSKLLRLKRDLQRLINPAQVDQEADLKIVLDAKEFRVEDNLAMEKKEEWNIINGPIKNFIFEKLRIKTTELHCSIDKEGKEITTELIDKGNFIFKIREKNEFEGLHDIKITVFYLNEGAKRTFASVMGIQVIHFGSIFLYKNGIRISPYGNPDDDWLDLDRRKTQGMRRYLGTREVLGRIELHGPQPSLKEVTSRDGGVVKTKQYYSLKKFFIEKGLRRLERFVVEALGWEKISDKKEITEKSLKLISLLTGQIKDPNKEIVFNKNLLQIVEDKEIEKIPEYLKNLEKLKKHVKSPKIKNQITAQIKAVRKATKALEKEKKDKEREVKDLKDELEETGKKVLFLENINPEALDIASITHTIGISAFTINENISHLVQNINALNPSEILENLEKIKFQVDKIETRSNMITHADFNMLASTIEADMVNYITQYLDNVSSPTGGGLKIEIENNEITFLKNFKHLELSVFIDNLLSNANKASATKILFKFEKKNGKLGLIISDNGKGIPDSIKDRVFNLGFTTTRGSGIGMFHVKKIMKKLDASIKLLGNKIEPGYPGATFEVLFNE